MTGLSQRLVMDLPAAGDNALLGIKTTGPLSPSRSETTRSIGLETKFFLEIFSGSGRLSDTLRAKYADVIVLEFDLTEKGRSKIVLTKSVLQEIKHLLSTMVTSWYGSAFRVELSPTHESTMVDRRH